MNGKELLPAPQNIAEARQIAQILAGSQLTPQSFRNKPDDIVVAMMWSHTLGLPIVQGLQHICVINGKPSMYGDGLLAVVMASGQLLDIKEKYEGQGDLLTAVCTVTRRGKETPTVGTFSMKDAEKASLLKKPGPWQQYPKRMLKMRARAYALRDAFPDVLSGMTSAEEQQDVIDSSAVEVNREEVKTEAAPAVVKKMPRRITKKAAAPVEDVPVNEPEPVPVESIVPVEDVPVEEPAPAEETPPFELSGELKAAEESQGSLDAALEVALSQIEKSTTRKELTDLWRQLPITVQTSKKLVAAFQKRQAEINQLAGAA